MFSLLLNRTHRTTGPRPTGSMTGLSSNTPSPPTDPAATCQILMHPFFESVTKCSPSLLNDSDHTALQWRPPSPRVEQANKAVRCSGSHLRELGALLFVPALTKAGSWSESNDQEPICPSARPMTILSPLGAKSTA